MADYIRDLRPAKRGSEIELQSSNPETLMSALGHKRTLRNVRSMSALPPKADIAERDQHVRFVPIADIATEMRPTQFSQRCLYLSGLRRGCTLHRRKIGDGAHPTRELPTAGSKIAKSALARHFDGDG